MRPSSSAGRFRPSWTVGLGARAPGRDGPRVEAGEVQPAVEARVLDLDAPVHDDLEPGGLTLARDVLVPRAELEPQRLRADGERLGEHPGEVVVAPEHVDEVGHDGQRLERRECGAAEDLARVGVDEVHVEVRARQQVGADEVARSRRVVRGSDDRDRARAPQDGEPVRGARARPGAALAGRLRDGARDAARRWRVDAEHVGAHRVLPVAAVSAWSRSHRMSSGSSRPTEMRTRSSGTPAAASCSAVSCWWVVEPGWMTSVRASPMLARWLASTRDSMNTRPTSRAGRSSVPTTPKANTEPGPWGR